MEESSETANQTVWIYASPELLEQMKDQWSPLVQVMINPPEQPGGPWQMTIREGDG